MTNEIIHENSDLQNNNTTVLSYRFVKFRLGFVLEGFRIELVDEDLKDTSILTLHLDTVRLDILQQRQFNMY